MSVAASIATAGLGVVMGVPPLPAASSAPASGVTATAITIGLITDLTGPAAEQYTGMVPSVQARIDLQNERGGVDGRRIRLLVEDDGTNPATNQAASQALLAKGVFGVIDQSAVVFGGYRVLQQAGIPVTGGAYDGPEWGQRPNTNMFSISGPLDPGDPATTTVPSFIKAHGGEVVGSLGYAISPSSQASATGFAYAAKKLGLQVGYLNTSLPFGTLNVTDIALQMKASHVDSLYLPLDQNTNFAILTALQQLGVRLKVAVSATGYGQELLDDHAALPDAQGTYFPTVGEPVELKTPATRTFQAALARYAHYTGVPGFDWYEGWASADLMITGLELAGTNPTRSRFIAKLHHLTHYTANGLLQPANLSLAQFGRAPTRTCSWFTELEGDAFLPVPRDGAPVCGRALPGSDQLR